MRVAVMSDIHGFAPALEAVITDVDRKNVDQIVAAGDLFEGGPGPGRVLELLRIYNVRCVCGNTDRDLLASQGGSDTLAHWTRERIGPKGMAFLRNLPFSIRIAHPERPDDPAACALIVHANPVDVDRHLSPNASEREIQEILGAEIAQTIVFGHLHVAYVRQIGNHTLIDVSAVGNPRDGDLRPRYVILESAPDGRWSHEYHYLDYPLSETRRQMEETEMPDWKTAFERLESATYNRPI
jgi:predicted phosphodiesterase